MTTETAAGIESAADREVFTTRLLSAARERVFRAFSDPAQLMHWWGPSGFSNTFHEFDLRPGGAWRFVMHGPDGVDYPNESVFVTVMPPERVVFRHVSKPQFEMTITFAEHPGGTLVGWRQRFDSAAECQRLVRVVIPANEQNLDRLQAQLARGGE